MNKIVNIEREHLRLLVDAAWDYLADMTSGLADGTYEDDPGVDAITEAIAAANRALKS
jgi:hypothetical protein